MFQTKFCTKPNILFLSVCITTLILRNSGASIIVTAISYIPRPAEGPSHMQPRITRINRARRRISSRNRLYCRKMPVYIRSRCAEDIRKVRPKLRDRKRSK